MNELSNIASKTNNDVILWTIVIIIGLVLVGIPIVKLFTTWYKMITTAREAQNKQEFDREHLLIEVIQKNSEVISELKSVLHNTNSKCDTCKVEQLDRIKGINESIKEHSKSISKNNEVLNEVYNIILERGRVVNE